LGEFAVEFGLPMDDREPPSADYYRNKAEEIRRVARQARTLEVAAELLEIAERFERMAAHVERWLERHYLHGSPQDFEIT